MFSGQNINPGSGSYPTSSQLTSPEQPPSYPSQFGIGQQVSSTYGGLQTRSNPGPGPVRRVDLQDIKDRPVVVRGVQLPHSDWTVSHQGSTQTQGSPVVTVVGDSVRIRGTGLPPGAGSNSAGPSGLNTIRGGIVIGDLVIAGRHANINGVRVKPGFHSAASLAKAARPNLPPVEVDVHSSTAVTATNCQNVTVQDITEVQLAGSGTSSAYLTKVDVLVATISGASSLVASGTNSAELVVCDASKATLSGATGKLRVTASGRSKVRGEGDFERVVANASGVSRIVVRGSVDSASTSSSVLSRVSLGRNLG